MYNLNDGEIVFQFKLIFCRLKIFCVYIDFFYKYIFGRMMSFCFCELYMFYDVNLLQLVLVWFFMVCFYQYVCIWYLWINEVYYFSC